MVERILVVGGGAIGGVTAGLLARAGVDVSVLDADAAHARLMREPGLLLDELGTVHRVPLRAATSAEELEGRFDAALVTLKSLHLRAALTPLVDGDLVDTYVSLGNGLVQDVVADVVGSQRTLCGVVEWGATNLGPGHLAQTTRAPFVVGEPDGTVSERAHDIAAVLARIAPGTAATGRIRDVIWTKLLLNSTFSGLGAVGGMLYGEVAADPLGRRLAYALWAEGHAVADAQGLQLETIFDVEPGDLVVTTSGDPTRADAALARMMRRAGPTKASMLQDLERGARTEVDVINGGVATTGRRLGVPTPLNDEIVAIIHDDETTEARPGSAGIRRLATLI